MQLLAKVCSSRRGPGVPPPIDRGNSMPGVHRSRRSPRMCRRSGLGNWLRRAWDEDRVGRRSSDRPSSVRSARNHKPCKSRNGDRTAATFSAGSTRPPILDPFPVPPQYTRGGTGTGTGTQNPLAGGGRTSKCHAGQRPTPALPNSPSHSRLFRKRGSCIRVGRNAGGPGGALVRSHATSPDRSSRQRRTNSRARCGLAQGNRFELW